MELATGITNMRRTPRSKLQFKGIPYKTRAEVMQAIKEICDKLSKPLPLEEQAEGWTEMRQKHFLNIFQQLETDLHSGIPYLAMGKNLDYFGIDGGQLLEDACGISISLDSRNRNW